MAEEKCCKVFWGTFLSTSTLMLLLLRQRVCCISVAQFPPHGCVVSLRHRSDPDPRATKQGFLLLSDASASISAALRRVS